MRFITTTLMLLWGGVNLLFAQSATLTYSQSQDTVYLCSENLFSVNLTFQGYTNPTLTLSANTVLDCSQTSFCNLSPIEAIEIVSGNVPQFTQTSTGNWVLNGLLNNTPYSFTYKLRIDCNAIRNCQSLDSTGGTFNQEWSINGDSIPSIGVNQSIPILMPFIVEITKPILYGNYGDHIPMTREYRNTGKGPADIFFQFTPFAESLCGGDSILIMHYAIGDSGLSTGAVSFTQLLSSGGWYKVTIPSNKSLYVRKMLLITGCLMGTNCANQSDVFKWRCDTSSAGCNSCQQLYDQKIPLQLTQDRPRFEIQVQSPQDPAQDFSCFGSSVAYEINLVNKGPVNMPFATISFYVKPAGINQLGLIDSSTFSVTPIFQNSFSNVSQSPFSYLTGAMCSTAVPEPISGVYLYVKDFMVGDTIKLNYDLYKCCEPNDTLYNMGLGFNHWAIDSWVGTACRDTISLHYNERVGNAAGWTTILDYEAAVFDMTVPQGATFGPSTGIMFMDVASPANCTTHNNIFGCSNLACSTQSCIRNGYLSVRFDLDTGLIMDSLIPYFESYLPPYTNQWHPVYSQSNYSTGTCSPSSTTFYFDLSDSHAYELLNKSRLFFEFKSCCFAPPSSFYKISFDILPRPNSGCDSLAFANGFPDILNLCWLPVAQVTEKINIRCPGCLAPGFEALSYDMKRITYGLEDQDNNGKADPNLTPITEAYIDSHKYFIKSRSAQALDIVQDFLIGDFIDGDSLNGGYNYQQILDDGGKFNSLQILRKVILDNGKNSGLEPIWFRFYVDSLSANDTVHCYDCDQFSKSNNFYTLHVLEGNASNMASFLEKDSIHMLFSFDVTNPSNPFFTDSVPTGYSGGFPGFRPYQRYRMTVKYKVCSDWGPNTNECGNQDIKSKVSTSEILNYGFFSGKRQAIDSLNTFPAMYEIPAYNTAAQQALVYTNYGQGFANNSVFWCVRNSGRMRFYGRELQNTSKLLAGKNNKCQPFFWTQLLSRTAGCDLGLFPYEFRAPSWIASKLDIQIPPGYTTGNSVYAYTYNRNPDGSNHDYWPDFDPNYPTKKIPISIIPTTGNFNLDIDSILTLNNYGCITDNYSFYPPDSTRLFCSDNYFNLNIIIPLYATDSCQPGRKIPINNGDVMGGFVPNLLTCLPVGIPVVCNTDTIKLPSGQKDTLRLPDAKLSLVFLPDSVRVISDKVCWKFSMENTVNSPGYYAFVAPPAASYFSNWSLTNGNNINLFQGVFPLGNINGNSTLSGYTLCAQYDSCAGFDTLQVYYGWDCFKYPTRDSIYQVCYVDSAQIKFKDGIVNVQTGLTHPGAIGLCTPFTISANLYSTAEGHIAPIAFGINNLSGYNLNSITISSCQDSLIQFNIPINGDSLWNVAHLADSLFKIYALNLGNCLTIMATMELNCNMNLLANDSIMLPEISYYYSTFCNSDTLVTIAHRSLLPQPAIASKVVYSGVSSCSGCLSVTKTAVPDTITVGDPMLFDIVVCGNNGTVQSYILNEFLPPGFIATSTIPQGINLNGQPNNLTTSSAQGCDTIKVFGYYSIVANCPNTKNSVSINQLGINPLSADVCVAVFPRCMLQSNIVIPDSSFSTSYPIAIYDSIIFISGRFYVNDTLNLYNCTVYAASGAQIMVQWPGSLHLFNSIIMGCDSMWQGITVNSNAKLFVVEKSQIKDANIAVFVNDKGSVILNDSKILDCVTGVYTPPFNTIHNISLSVTETVFGMDALNFKANYVGQPGHGLIPKAGIELNDMNFVLGGNGIPNEFYNLNMGIYARNSNITVKNSKFLNIRPDNNYLSGSYRGTAMVAYSDNAFPAKLTILPESSTYNTVENSYRAVYTDGAVLNASFVHFDYVEFGIMGTRTPALKTSIVEGCTINTANYGIYWIQNPAATSMIARNNIINVNAINSLATTSFSYRYSGIYIAESTHSRVIHSITGNDITIDNGYFGIVGLKTALSQIKFNTINLSSTSDALRSSGISNNGSLRNNVSCNVITGHFQNTGAASQSNAISTNISTGNYVSCNSVDDTKRGFYFGGFSPQTRFKGNDINSHFEGLYLNSTAVIDTQPYFGNRWQGAYGGFGAINLNTAIVQIQGVPQQSDILSLFVYDTTNSIVFRPTLSATLNPDWFRFNDQQNTYACAYYTVCESVHDRLTSDQLTELIATGAFESAEYAEESKAVAEAYLFEQLMADSSNWVNDSLLVEFVREHLGDPVGYLYSTDESLRAAGEYDLVFSSLIEDAYTQIDLLVDSINTLNQLAEEGNPITNHEQVIEQLYFAIDFTNQTIENLLIIREPFVQDLLLEAELNNNLVVPEALPQYNAQFMNEIEMRLLETGGDLLEIETSYLDILAIAQQCPYAGGQAVYSARAIVAMLNDSVVYDDYGICLQSGIYRSQQNASKNTASKLKIVPNPANDLVQIILDNPDEGICQIKISNIAGLELMKKSYDCLQNSTLIDTKNIKKGMYIVTVSNQMNMSKFEKLVIIR